MKLSQVRKFLVIFVIAFLLSSFVYAQVEELKFWRIHKVKFEKVYVPSGKRYEVLEHYFSNGLLCEILAVFFSNSTEMWLFWTDDKTCIDINSSEFMQALKKKGKKSEEVEIIIHNHLISDDGIVYGLTYGDIQFYGKLKKAGVNAKFLIWCEGVIYAGDINGEPTYSMMPIEEFEKIKKEIKNKSKELLKGGK